MAIDDEQAASGVYWDRFREGRAVVALAELHQEIRAAIEAGELERPRQLCRAILALRPDNLETLLLDAELHLEVGTHRLAISGFERVLTADPEAYLACAGLGIAYEGLRDPSAALHWYSRALDLEPMNREIRRERDRLFELAYPGSVLPARISDFATARSFLSAGFGSKALETYRLALHNEPGRLEVKLGLAELLWLLEHRSEAQGLCQQILNGSPRVVKALAILACIAAETGEVEQGRTLLTDVHAQDPAGRIASHLIVQTPLAPWASEAVDLKISLGTPSATEWLAEAPGWSSWMRHALWQVLRLVLPTAEEGAPETDEDDAAVRIQAIIEPSRPQPTSTTGPLGRRLRASQPATGAEAGADQDRATTAEQALVSEEIVHVPLNPLIQPPIREPPLAPTTPQPPRAPRPRARPQPPAAGPPARQPPPSPRTSTRRRPPPPDDEETAELLP